MLINSPHSNHKHNHTSPCFVIVCLAKCPAVMRGQEKRTDDNYSHSLISSHSTSPIKMASLKPSSRSQEKHKDSLQGWEWFPQTSVRSKQVYMSCLE